ncbi:hypothetical protein Dimus_007253 [Dionaea muscipula]
MFCACALLAVNLRHRERPRAGDIHGLVHQRMNLKSLLRCSCSTTSQSLASLPLSNPHFKTFSASVSNPRTQINTLSKSNALTVLDLLLSSKQNPKHSRCRGTSHLRLIESFLPRNPEHYYIKQQQLLPKPNTSGFPGKKPRKQMDPRTRCLPSKKVDDAISVVSQLRREGLRVDVSVASTAFSACGFLRSRCFGVQLHCFAVRSGISMNLYVGSSLIGFYSKCGDLCSACKVFNEMPVQNVVSWTALISGFANEWRVDTCLKLYTLMRESILEPNDFTFTTILSACMGSGSLGKGKSTHCQTLRLGFDSHTHIGNALISMYCKCGSVGDAFLVFESMGGSKDTVSWNSMITGHALHGLHRQAIDTFEKMGEQKIKPDAITFLGVLSSCCHAGRLDQGHFYFSSMMENGLKPDLDHYSCMVDLLCRAGLLKEARDFILNMPIQPNAIIWGTLLSSCRLRGDVWIGIEAAEHRLGLEPGCAATHVQLANLYATVGLWDEAARVRKKLKERELKTNPGHSLIEIGHEVYRFRAEDTLNNSRLHEILMVLDTLTDLLISQDHMPEQLHNEIDDDDLCLRSN